MRKELTTGVSRAGRSADLSTSILLGSGSDATTTSDMDKEEG